MELLAAVPVLPLARVLSVATAFPLLAGPGAPRQVRIGTALALACVLVPLPFLVPQPALTPARLLLLLPFEVFLGLAVGFAFSLLFHTLAVAGDFLGQEMGLNAASQIDPVTGQPVPLLARLFELIGLVLFVELGGLRLMLHTIRHSFLLVPPGALAEPGALGERLAQLCAGSVSAGIAVALPAALLLLLLTLFTTITARVLPKLHIFDFAYAIRMLAAIFLVALLLPRLVPAMIQFTDRIVDALGGGLEAR